jgi:hypothetical protein
MRILKSAGCLTPIAALIYGIVGILLLSQFGGQTLNYIRSMGWEQVPGTVESTSVEDVWDTTGDRYDAQIVYTYDVDGTTYEGDQIDLRGSVYAGNRDDADELLAPYPAGESVMVYVDPADPTRAVLDRNMPGAIWAIAGTGVMLILLSLGLGIRYLTSQSQKSQQA